MFRESSIAGGGGALKLERRDGQCVGVMFLVKVQDGIPHTDLKMMCVIIWARTILLRSSHSLHMTTSNPPKTAGKGAYICSAAWLRTCHGNAKGVMWHLV